MSTVKANTIEPASGGTVTITGAALTTPALGTAASGTLTNCTGLPASTGLSGTTLASSVVNASLNAITPSGGTLALTGSQTISGNLVLGNTSPASSEGYRFYKNYGRYDNGTFIGFIGGGDSLGGAATDFAFRSEYALTFMAGGGGTDMTLTADGQLQVHNGGLTLGDDSKTWYDPYRAVGYSWSLTHVLGRNQTALTTGAYQDTYGGAWKHRGGYGAAQYFQSQGAHVFRTSISAETADGTVSWLDQLVINSSGSISTYGSITALAGTTNGITLAKTSAGTYGAISFNGSTATGGFIGVFGGDASDNKNLYLNSLSDGFVGLRVGSNVVAQAFAEGIGIGTPSHINLWSSSATGLTVKATGGNFGKVTVSSSNANNITGELAASYGSDVVALLAKGDGVYPSIEFHQVNGITYRMPFAIDGGGSLQFGTYTGTPGSITGYIEIKDSGGTVRKLAVIS